MKNQTKEQSSATPFKKKSGDQGPATNDMNGRKRSPLVVIFLTVFIDLVGFGIIIPLSPYLAREYHATPIQIGLLMAIYSVMQFLFSPFWGSLSDRIGRRPVILISLLGSAGSYLIFSLAHSLELLFVSRALAGLFGGNISAAHAYIADVTSVRDRSKGMGLIGAAFGLGFVCGPILGGIFGHVGSLLGSMPPFGTSFAALIAALICFSNFVFAYKVLEESRVVKKDPERRKLKLLSHRFRDLWSHLQKPLVGSLIMVFFLSGLAMAQMEAMLFPLVADRFQWGLETASYGFAYVGVLMVLTQGWLVRKWLPRFGEPLVLGIGLGLFCLSLLGIALANSIAWLALTMTVLAIGNGMMRPPNVGLISLLSSDSEQGSVMGVTNSTASFGRIVGPVAGGFFYEKVDHSAPFLFASFLSAIALVLVLVSYKKLPTSALETGNDSGS